MPGILGKKIGMTSIFNTEGDLITVTVIQAGPCKVVSLREKEKDGYSAVVIGFEDKKEKHVSKPVLGQFKKNNLSPNKTVKEFKGFDTGSLKIGDDLKVDLFKEGDIIKVRGRSKGKGFQGVMKRHNFGGVGGTTHGQSDRLRAPGSIGASSWPSRVFKGQRMAGRKGFENVTVRNLKVIKIIPDDNLIMIKGAVPGSINSIVELIKN
ncbi:MAG: 50S ribosomal protein L3 [Ignavibacteriota bacterium]|nr:MAG: 50S ribosomal protein L3 [Chlorobiota bacterium]MBE7476946.1 50S ribosomal protein L3 [Ignavibacteriales bacterium]MBL1121804.1 50S ribosomal protein L3 [Ignavibacteriota bacterium]MCC7093376.1 50S ribosomal protein L3 [Ignavibacteriaceae bacterium]MCE7855306.1 50S ribosomal protein L3 [Ignavibacteria bacterium CHB3]MEB2295601.1 50S ribosomal protein L3 [Ignavibacteria bacterium]